MLVKYFKTLNDVKEFEVSATSLKEVLNFLKHTEGASLTDELLHNKFKYVLADSTNKEEPIALRPEVVWSEFGTYDILFIVPEVSGEVTAAVLIPILAGLTEYTLVIATVAAFVINTAIAIGISALISLISPTPEYDNDPSRAQANLKQSNLFNGAPLIREQGGIVPIIFGNPYCGGVLISSGASTEDII